MELSLFLLHEMKPTINHQYNNFEMKIVAAAGKVINLRNQ